MISQKIEGNLKKSSWIRAMFEEGEKLRKKYGSKNVFDFSIGNPEIEPPRAVLDKIIEAASDKANGKHRYMSNAGYDYTREKLAGYINSTKGSNLTKSHVVMTCGAAGGLNAILKTILNPGDEVIVFSPYFVEYLFYIDNHGGNPVILPADTSTFQPEPDIVKNYINKKTKAVIINNPNNPTGVIYSEETMQKLAKVLEIKEKEYGNTIFVLSDEPYDRIIYDGAFVPSVFNIFKNSMIVNSFSKSLALPGERIGYVAVNDKIDNSQLLLNGLVFCNRTLGFVNAPAFMQRIVADTLHEAVDIESYREKRNILYNHLVGLGFDCIKPKGAFYLFPKTPMEDDILFCKRAQEYNLLLVPGKGFGCPGHVRLAYCISMETIKNSLPAFEKLAKALR